MKKSMCITYEVDGSLYVNMTNRCSNRCSFCIRNNGDGAYGSDSLWLEREPTLDETVASVLSHDLTAYRELVFCGYGEPTYRLNDAREVALAAKRMMERGEPGDGASLAPNYLRLSQAERERLARENR